MKEKFKAWADEIRGTAAYNGNEAMHEAANFLQRMADMPDEEPDSDENYFDINGHVGMFVTKEYADWHIAEKIKLQCAFDEYRRLATAHQQALHSRIAVSYAHIAELQSNGDIVKIDRNNAIRRISELSRDKEILQSRNPNQPRPLLKDQPEVFDALMDFIGTSFEVLGKFSTPEDLVKSKAALRKLLVGDVP